MKKLACLVLLVLASVFVCVAQQGPEPLDTQGGRGLSQAGERLFVHFSAEVKESNKVILQWDIDSSTEGDYFIVERSSEGGPFETVGAQVSNAGKLHYELVDQAPPNGSDLYRIHYTSAGGVNLYSKSEALSMSGDVDFKFYPNPVDKLFIVRTEHSIELEVLDPSGAVRISKRLQPGIQVINATALEHGVYILRVTDKESNRAISRQLVKN
jgi:hypothetical protein